MPGPTTYESWIQNEGVPVVEGFGIEDLMQLPREPWSRTGGKGAFIQLRGMEGFSGMYVGEIPPGASLNPEKHLYDELIYILRGRGATEVGWEKDSKKVSFEWETGGLFALPLNSTHRLLNGSREPVVYLGVTSAPLLMDLTHDPDFIFAVTTSFARDLTAIAIILLPRRTETNRADFGSGNRISSPMSAGCLWIPPSGKDRG
jgi:mannose-6-phosphate isomerase-like protein (cupin superfamily)